MSLLLREKDLRTKRRIKLKKYLHSFSKNPISVRVLEEIMEKCIDAKLEDNLTLNVHLAPGILNGPSVE